MAEIVMQIDANGVAKWSLKSRNYGVRKFEQIGLNRKKLEPLPTASGCHLTFESPKNLWTAWDIDRFRRYQALDSIH